MMQNVNRNICLLLLNKQLRFVHYLSMCVRHICICIYVFIMYCICYVESSNMENALH